MFDNDGDDDDDDGDDEYVEYDEYDDKDDGGMLQMMNSLEGKAARNCIFCRKATAPTFFEDHDDDDISIKSQF